MRNMGLGHRVGDDSSLILFILPILFSCQFTPILGQSLASVQMSHLGFRA